MPQKDGLLFVTCYRDILLFNVHTVNVKRIKKIFATMALGCITKNKRAKLLDYSSVLAINISQWYPVLLIHSSVAKLTEVS